jgi:hypothetical protein
VFTRLLNILNLTRQVTIRRSGPEDISCSLRNNHPATKTSAFGYNVSSTEFAYLDGVRQRLSIFGSVLPLDVPHVDLAPRHHQSDQVAVVGPHPLHALVQALGEERRLVLDGAHHRQQPFLDVPRELVLDGLLDVVSGEALVLFEDHAQLGMVPLAEDHVECRLVCAELEFSGSEERLGVGGGRLGVGHHGLVAPRAAQRHHQALEVAAGVASQVVLQVLVVRWKKTFSTESRNAGAFILLW